MNETAGGVALGQPNTPRPCPAPQQPLGARIATPLIVLSHLSSVFFNCVTAGKERFCPIVHPTPPHHPMASWRPYHSFNSKPVVILVGWLGSQLRHFAK